LQVNSRQTSIRDAGRAIFPIFLRLPAGEYPNTLAYDSENDNIYFGQQSNDLVSVVNASTDLIERSVGIGFEPLAMAADPVTGNVFVTGSNSTGTAFMAVISGSNGTVVTTFAFGANRFPVAGPDGLAYDPVNGEFYVASTVGGAPQGTRGNLTIVDGALPSVVKNISLSFNPDGIVYAPSTGNLYLGNQSGDNLSVFDPATASIVAKVTLPSTPTILTYGSTHKEVYVAIDGNVSVVSTSSNKVVKAFPVTRQPDGLAFDTVNGDLYISDYVWNNVSAVNTTTFKVAVGSILLGALPYNMAYDPSNGDLYVADLESDQLIEVSGSTNRLVRFIPLGTTPYGVAYDPITRDIYVDDYSAGNVSIVSGVTNSVIGYLPAGLNPWGIAYDGADRELYVTNVGSNNITVLSPGPKTVVRSLAFSSPPGAIAYDSRSSTLFIGQYNVGNVTVLNASTNAVITEAATGLEPYTISIDPGTGDAFVGNYASDNVTVLGPLGQELGLSITVGLEVFGSAYNPVDGDVYVASFGSDLVNVINSTTAATVGGYTVGSGPVAIAANPVSGVVYVANYDSGSLTLLTRSATPATYKITFNATGLPSGRTWSVALGGTVKSTTKSTIEFVRPNGSYAYLILGPNDRPVTGFAPSGTVVVDGAAVVEHLGFSAGHTYSITFKESGLPAGTSWCLELASKLCSTSNEIVLKNVTNGSYDFSVFAVPGFTATPASGTVQVTGPAAGTQVRFH
jgi:YVTN family beta-propeller protein